MSNTSVYTPSILGADALEALFVAREPILQQIAERLLTAERESVRNHTLLIGPRGAGKTHLVALAYHRASERVAGGARIRLSWLPEDPWGIASYRVLLRELLQKEHGAPAEVDRHLGDEELEHEVKQRTATGGPLVVFLENLDQILEAIGEKGQRRLRHLAQSGALLLVATTTRLGRALASTDGPLYGFFTETELRPFTVDEATAMLQKIAERRGDTRLTLELATPEARVRLRTITHLAGGQPRIWAILADSLSINGVLSSTEALMSIFDRLTPYYQEQLSRLSPNQRVIVSTLVDEDRAMTVKDLAESTGISQRSLSSTLVDLKARAWVAELDSAFTRMLKDKRVTYYDLAEPMARVVFQMKNTKNDELPRLLVDFLGLWFDIEVLADLDEPVKTVLAHAFTEERIVLSRLLLARSGPTPRVPSATWQQLIAALSELSGTTPGATAVSLPTMIRCALEDAIDERGFQETFWRTVVGALLSAQFSPGSNDAAKLSEVVMPILDPVSSLKLFLLCRSGNFDTAARLRSQAPPDVLDSDLPELSTPQHPFADESPEFQWVELELQFAMSTVPGVTDRMAALVETAAAEVREYGKALVSAAEADNHRRRLLSNV